MILGDISESPRHGLHGHLGDTDRQGPTVTTQVLYSLGGIVQRRLDISRGNQVLGSAEHF